MSATASTTRSFAGALRARTFSGDAPSVSAPVRSTRMNAELHRLRREVKDLRIDREILRKAAAYFAQETIR